MDDSTIIDVVSGRDYFPEVDFKYINRGNATAVMWKLGIQVESMEIDKAPHLSCSAKAEPANMEFTITNNGWGEALIDKCSVIHPLLNKVFGAQCVSSKVVVESGGSIQTVNIDFSSINAVESAILGDLARYREDTLDALPNAIEGGDISILDEEYFECTLSANEKDAIRECFFPKTSRHGISRMSAAELKAYELQQQKHRLERIARIPRKFLPIEDVLLESQVVDSLGRKERIELKVNLGSYENDFFLSKNGFNVQNGVLVCAMMATPTVRFISLLKHSDGQTEKCYSTSIVTSPGGFERFKVVVGADRSCMVKASFNFYFDNQQVVRSSPFALDILCPRGYRSSAEDGSQFVMSHKDWALADENGNIFREKTYY